MINIQTILSTNKMWTWRYSEKHTSLTHKLLFLEGKKTTWNIRRDCEENELLCYVLLSAVHFTIQGSTRIDCDLFFYFWIGTTRNKIPVRQLACTSQQWQWSMPHAKSKPVRAPPSKNGHCHSHLVCYKQPKLESTARKAQSINKSADKWDSISFILELS